MTGKRPRTIAVVALCLVVSALAMECSYRAFLYVRFPERFVVPPRDERISVFDQPMWEYDQQFGYSYSAGRRVNTSIIENGRVTQCQDEIYANEQGNIGPSVPDFSSADFRIAVFGDSFTASAIDEVTWPSILQSKLESGSAKTVRVMNLARDGYGILQMFDLAAARIPELRPTLVIFAFNYTALPRGRSWRVLVGSGEKERFVSTEQNSSNPNLQDSSDLQLIMPSATRQWCRDMLAKSPEQQAQDDFLRRLISKSRDIESQNPTAPLANPYDLKSSYVFNLLVYRKPFYSQLRRLQPGINPTVKYNDFREDRPFVRAVKAVNATGVPYIVVHLPLGSHVKVAKEFHLDPQSESLLHSLDEITGRPVFAMFPYLSVAPEDGMSMCKKPKDCHPSVFGMHSYADAVIQIIKRNRISGAPQ